MVMKLDSKQDFQSLMHLFLDPLLPHYSAGGALLSLGDTGATYPRQTIDFEAFSRPLWALVPFWMGGGRDEAFETVYRKGFAAGADPESTEYWGGFGDYDQRFVEMAAIACGLLFAPERLWQPLTDGERQRLASWLNGINEHFVPLCNWQFFRVLVNVALKRLGMPYNEQKLGESLAEIESYYVGGGWYKDGVSNQKDYYVPFALHYYGLVYAKVLEKDDPERSARYKARAMEFAQDFIYWFADDGSALPFGRSLTYRFAQASFWTACLFAGIEPFPVTVMKGIITRHFEYWLGQRMFDRDGILTIGYAYPNLIMAERYNAPGSPYWSMKSFLLLALPDDHPFWTADAAPLPELDSVKALPRAELLIQRRENDTVAYAPGVCELYGHGHLVEKYSKFAYSTAFGFSVMRSSFVLNEACPDCMLAFVIDDTVFVRKNSDVWQVSSDHVYSEWRPFPGISVKTTVTPTPSGHVRRHEIESEYQCIAVDYGFAVPKFAQGSAQELTEHKALVRTAKYFCAVSGVGPDAAPQILNADPNTSLLFTNTLIPGVRYTIGRGRTVLESTVEAEVRG